jgi:hypothetical protein
MRLPLFLIVGVRSYFLHLHKKTSDTCPIFTEPIVQAWQLSYVVLDERHGGDDLANAYRQAQAERRAGAVLIAE